MPIGTQDYRRFAGEFSHRTSHYVPDYLVQQKINRMACRNESNTPQALGWASTLFLASTLSNLSCGRNALATTEYKSPQHANHTEIANVSVMPILQCIHNPIVDVNIPTSTAYVRDAGNLFENNKVSSVYSEPVSFYIFAQRVIKAIFERSNTMGLNDLFKFPAAEASIPKQETTLTTLSSTTDFSDEVSIKKINFNCIEERSELSAADVLTKIADALESPVKEMVRELQIVKKYIVNGVCPSTEEINKVLSLASETDEFITNAMSLFPEFTPVLVTQKIVAPLLRMIAEEMQGKAVTDIEISNVNEQMLTLARAMIDFFPKGENGQPTLDQSSLPEGISISNGELYVTVDGDNWLLFKKNEQWYVNKGDITRPVRYHETDAEWQFCDEVVTERYTENDDLFFTACRYRERRGANLATVCRITINDEESISDHSDPTSFSDISQSSLGASEYDMVSNNYQLLINDLAILLPKTSPRVTQMQFYDDWIIYRVRASDDVRSTFFHAIEINGKLVPVRTKKIHQFNVHCEIYDLKNPLIGYPVEFHHGHWELERPTSINVAPQLQEIVQPGMYAKGIVAKDLSTPGANGLKWNVDGRSFLKINHRFVEVKMDGINPYIADLHGDKFYLSFDEGKFSFTKALCANGLFSVNANQLKMDRLMLSAKGLKIRLGEKLNEGWKALSVKIKYQDYNDSNSVGSKIDVVFRLEYTPNEEIGFIDEPRLRWVEKIKFRENDKIWQFSTNMFRHNQHSRTFFPWRYRYVEAYHFSKHRHKKFFHGTTRLYDVDRLPVSPDELPFAAGIDKQIDAVKEYLTNHGGILEVMITDVPQLRVRDGLVHKERVVNFDLGFGDKSLVKFSQGIVLTKENVKRIFVTTSDDIRIATGEVNAEPPEHVSRRREQRRRS